jgi:hypothetical protein
MRNLFGDSVSSRNNQDRHIGIRAAHSAEDLTTAKLWQLQIKNQQIVIVGVRQIQAFFSCVHDIDAEAL